MKKRKFQLKNNKVYIIPTGPGVAYVFSVLGILLAASAYGNNQLYILAFMLIVIGIISMHYTNANVKAVEFVDILFVPIEAHSSGGGQIILQNSKSEDVLSCDLEVETNSGIKASSNCDLIVGKSSVRANILFESNKRGVEDLKKMRISSRYPLGLFYAWKPIALSSAVYIYPSPQKNNNRKLDMGWQSKASLDSVALHGADFDHIRPYKEGDNLKRIDWKSVAKGRPMATKEFLNEDGGSFVIELKSLPGSLEEKLEEASYLVNKFESEKQNYILKLYREQIGPGVGIRHQRLCRVALAKEGISG